MIDFGCIASVTNNKKYLVIIKLFFTKSSIIKRFDIKIRVQARSKAYLVKKKKKIGLKKKIILPFVSNSQY